VGQEFVVRRNKGAKLRDKGGLFGHCRVDEFSDVAGHMARELHEKELDKVAVVEGAFER
jgi:hypothetical protein